MPSIHPLAPHFAALAQGQLAGAEPIRSWDDSGHLILQTHWILGGSTLGRVRQSRVVRIRIGRDALVDYAAAGLPQRIAADQRFGNWLRAQLGTIDPTLAVPLGRPYVEWVLSTLLLNG